MNAVFTPGKLRIDVGRYQKMVETGVLTKNDRVELIEGEIVDMAPTGAKHAAVTARLTKLLIAKLGDAAVLSPGGPIDLGQFSEPQPDITLLKPRADFYSSKIPDVADVLLVVEVSDSTLAYDQGPKLALYARYGVPEYWVADVIGRKIVKYSEAAQQGYLKKIEIGSGVASPAAFPHIEIPLGELFGQMPHTD